MTEIVLLDDDPFMLRLLKHMLGQLGYRNVVAYDTGARALEAVCRPAANVDLILLDINMPGMDGIEFIRHLVNGRYEGSVILVSGEDARTLESIEKLLEAHHLHGLGHLQKPVNPRELGEAIRKLKIEARNATVIRQAEYLYEASELRAALFRGELLNYYQPKIALQTGEVVGFESLVRWQHARDGLVPPAQFIELATAAGLIGELTQRVLSSAVGHAVDWAEAGYPLPVSVNVSMDDLTALEFPDRAEAQVRALGIEPQHITFEVTEGQVMRDPSTVLDVLTRLRLKRFRLAIDDFGTGHASLSQLRDLPFDELKIDRGFVHDAHIDDTRSAICQASLRMAQQLKMQAVGEGIESQEDWDYLRRFGCEVGQGYFIARPMPASSVLDWLRQWQVKWPPQATRAG